ncbi:MAG: hypothetical protein IJE49_06400 [Agathobacter sp.]|nr:hypothetical protein [Agathobacter sp.]
MKKRITALLLCAVMVVSAFALTACGGKEATLKGNYESGAMGDYLYGGMKLGTTTTSYDLKLYDDGSYELVVAEIVIMSEMAGGVTNFTVYGTYEDGTVADGYHSVKLSAAERIVYGSYSTLGGYAFDYDTDVDTEFIIPGGDDVAIAKDKFISELGYGKETTIYIAQNAEGADTCHFEFEMK